jgi:hypothetical protein
MEQKVRIVKLGQADPKNGNCGYHEIGFENNRLGFIYVWFSDLNEIKTAEQALEIAEGIVKALNKEK